MRIGTLTFRPGLGLTVIALALIALCVRLGVWQLDRAEQKEKLQAAVASGATLPVLELRPGMEFSPALRFRKIVVKGRFEPDRQILLDNQTHEHRAGVHVLTPLRVRDSETRVLIDRGWIALEPSRTHLPDAGAPRGEVEVHRIIDTAHPPPFMLGAASRAGPAWGRLWPYLDFDYFSRHAGYRVQPYLIRQDPADPHGYVRVLPTVEMSPAMHIGYAIQWFGFAVVAFGVFAGMSLSSTARRRAEPQ